MSHTNAFTATLHDLHAEEPARLRELAAKHGPIAVALEQIGYDGPPPAALREMPQE